MLLQSQVLGALLLTIHHGTLLDVTQNNCLGQNYYGTYGADSLFVVDDECYASIQATLPLHTTSRVESSANRQLFYIYPKVVEESLGTPSLDGLIPHDVTENGQLVFSTSRQSAHPIIHQSNSDGGVLGIEKNSIPYIDHILPKFYKAIAIPASPLSLVPVPSDAVRRVKDLLDDLKFDPEVASIVSNISVAELRNDLRYLTGEDSHSPIVSRHSFTEGARIAAQWLRDRFEENGAKCELRNFLPGFAPDVICRYKAVNPQAPTVIVSGHYDSRGTFGSTRHPGADDDGSGTSALLAMARTISRKRIAFHSNVELVAFAGEEQGLLGSRAYAQDLRNENVDVLLMIQADMLAYHVPGEPAQLGFPETIGTPEVTQFVENIAKIYSPELTVGYTTACCSDHQSFHEQGFPATQVFERAGPIADPMYHNTGDVTERVGFDFYQLRSIAKVEMASLLHAAGYEIRDDEDY